jgi:hypothetical protein
MAAGNRFNSFIEYVNEKAVNWQTDTFVIALTNSAPSSSNSVLADITEISYTNLSSRTLTIAAASQTAGTYTATANQLTLTASGNVATFRYVVAYDDTATGDPLVGYWDYGSAVSMVNGDTFVIGATNPWTIWTDAPA